MLAPAHVFLARAGLAALALLWMQGGVDAQPDRRPSDQIAPTILIGPKADQQPRDEWIVVRWPGGSKVATADERLPDTDLMPSGRESPSDLYKQLTRSGVDSAAYVNGNRVLLYLNTEDVKPASGHLSTFVLKRLYSTPITPWTDQGGGFRLSIRAAVPYLEMVGRSVPYLAAAIVLGRKGRSGGIWVMSQFFDPRSGGPGSTPVKWNALPSPGSAACSPSRGTKMPIISAPALEPGTARGRFGSQAGALRSAAFADLTQFEVRLTSSDIRQILNKLDNGQDWCFPPKTAQNTWDLASIEVRQVSFQLEVFTGDQSAGTKLLVLLAEPEAGQ